MFGALLVKRVPGARASLSAIERAPQGLFLLWLAYVAMLLWATVLLWYGGGWSTLLAADPTMITFVIVVIFWAATLWVGARAWWLGREAGDQRSAHATSAYLALRKRHPASQPVAQAILVERMHGPHEMAWWVNGVLLKLGLLGKVIGFSILAMDLGQMNTFDPSQAAQLLKTVTGGLGIALLTTITGLTCNILLGLQLMRLDRFADEHLAQTLARGEEA